MNAWKDERRSEAESGSFSERAQFRKLGALPGGDFGSLFTQRTIGKINLKLSSGKKLKSPAFDRHEMGWIIGVFLNLASKPKYQLINSLICNPSR